MASVKEYLEQIYQYITNRDTFFRIIPVSFLVICGCFFVYGRPFIGSQVRDESAKAKTELAQNQLVYNSILLGQIKALSDKQDAQANKENDHYNDLRSKLDSLNRSKK